MSNPFSRSPYVYQLDIPIVLDCGCKSIWKDGFDLWQVGQYASCQTHGDTHIAQILTEPQYLGHAQLINATPHAINFYDERDVDDSNQRRLVVRPGAEPYLSIPPSGLVLNARREPLPVNFHELVSGGELVNVPIRNDEFPQVDEPPASRDDRRYIVSALYASVRRALGYDEPPLYTITGPVYESADAIKPCGCIALSVA